MKILVTGAGGFVGRALCARLAACPDMIVIAAARRAEGLPPGVEWRKIGDIGPDTDWTGIFTDVDAVAHLAARVHVMEDRAADPLAAFRAVNTQGTMRLAEAAAAAGVKRLVFLSSIKVNGEETGEVPFSEATPPAPADPYGVSKWEAEQELAALFARTGLETVVLRPPLVYGPGVRANFLALLRVASKGIPLPIGLIRNRRSLVSVNTLASAIQACLTHPAAAGRTFLVRDGEDVSSAELVRRMARALGRRARLFPVPPVLLRLAGRLTGRQGAVERLLGSLTVDDSAIRRELGWSPPETMDQALDATAQWFRARPKS